MLNSLIDAHEEACGMRSMVPKMRSLMPILIVDFPFAKILSVDILTLVEASVYCEGLIVHLAHVRVTSSCVRHKN